MSPKHERHLQRIKAEVARKLDAKYRRGQKHHGEFLPDKPLLEIIDEAIGEAIDQFTYLQTMRDLVVRLIRKGIIDARKRPKCRAGNGNARKSVQGVPARARVSRS